MIYKKAIICKTKNLFNYKTPEYVNATLIQSFPNGVILKGYASSSPGDQQYANGWFRPGDVNNANKRINLKAGEVVTISADYTLIEQYSSSSNKCNIYLYCSVTDFNNVVISQANLPLGQTVRISQTYTVKGDSDYYPVFTINSNTVMITNIQIEKGSTATNYVPYGYLQSYKKAIKVSDVCQLLDKSKYPATQTMYGVTFTNNSDGTITVNGTAASLISVVLSSFNVTVNNRYLLSGCPPGGYDNGNEFYRLRCFNGIGDDYGNSRIAYANKTGQIFAYLQINSGITVSNLTFKPQLFDLTEMYGKGNEPTTVEEFRQKFPNDLYPYRPYCFVDSYKKYLKIKEN